MNTFSLTLGFQQVAINNVLSSEDKMEVIHGLKLGITAPLIMFTVYALMFALFPTMNFAMDVQNPYLTLLHPYLLMPTFIRAYFRQGLPESSARLLRVCSVVGAVASGVFLYVAKF